MFGYVQGFAAGPELEEHMKKCKKLYKSHNSKAAVSMHNKWKRDRVEEGNVVQYSNRMKKYV